MCIYMYICIYYISKYVSAYLNLCLCMYTYICTIVTHTNTCNMHIKQCIYFPFFSTHQGVDVIPSLDTEHMLNSLAGRRHKDIKHNFFSPRSYCLVDEPDCFSDHRMRHRLMGGRFMQGHLEEKVTLLG